MKESRKRFLKQFLLILGILLALLLLTQLWLRVLTRHGQANPVPDFTGMTMADARQLAKKSSLKLDISDSLFLPNKPRGTVFRQVPSAGEFVKKNRRILLTINSVLPRKANAPSLVGYTLRQAKAELISQNFQLGTLTYTPDMATNNVLEQRSHGANLLPGTPIDAQSAIDLVLGVSPEYNIAYIPRLIGLNMELAKDVLTDHSLNVGRVIYDHTIRTATDSLAAAVTKQSPPASESAIWDLGTRVNLILSLAPPPAEKDTPSIDSTANTDSL